MDARFTAETSRMNAEAQEAADRLADDALVRQLVGVMVMKR
jgi:hypothetical protein